MEGKTDKTYLYKNKNHFANANSMRLSGQFCDVTIKVNDKEFPAHKIVLAANIKYFQTMFLNSFQESKQGVVTMKDVDETDFETFISFAYTGNILITNTNALGLLNIANYLGEDNVKKACIKFLNKNLNAQNACKAYLFANAIDCCSLKNKAKQIVSSHFKKCSETAEYFDFDCENLKEILDNVDFSESQQNLFEGIVRWILHDVKNRRIYISDLLSLIHMTELAFDYLQEYFHEITEKQRDIVNDVILFHRKKMQEQENIWQSLMIVNSNDEKLQLQFYDFKANKWGQLSEILDFDYEMAGGGAILNDKLYYTFYGKFYGERCLQVFDPSNNQHNMLSSKSGILSCSVMCACTRYLYFCGGYEKSTRSDKVLRYDPETNSFDTLTPMGNGRVLAGAIFYQQCLYVLGGRGDLDNLNSVEKYDFNTKSWQTVPSMKTSRIYPELVILDNKLYACGGDRDSSVEVYDPSTNSWQFVAKMNKRRNGFLAVAYDGKLLAIGGDVEKTAEVYDPSKDQWKMDHYLSTGLRMKCPMGGLVPSIYVKRYLKKEG